MGLVVGSFLVYFFFGRSIHLNYSNNYAIHNPARKQRSEGDFRDRLVKNQYFIMNSTLTIIPDSQVKYNTLVFSLGTPRLTKIRS